MSDEYLVVETDIPFGNVYAYRHGDKIKADAVKQNKWEEYVVGANTKAGRAAQGLPEDPEPSSTSARTRAGRPRKAAAAKPSAAPSEPSPEGSNAPEGGEES